MTEPNLDDLARAAKLGDRRDVDALLVAARPTVCRWALVWSGSPDVSEDIAQRVMLKVNDAIGQYEPSASVSTWLYQITRRALLDHERGRRRFAKLRDRLKLDRMARDAARGEGLGPLAPILLREMMDVLSPRQRAIVDLVDLQGFRATEVAEMLDIEAETVRTHLHRARQALKARADTQEGV